MTDSREHVVRPPHSVVPGPDLDRIMEDLQKGEAVWAGSDARQDGQARTRGGVFVVQQGHRRIDQRGRPKDPMPAPDY
jgi:hypothetical protein